MVRDYSVQNEKRWIKANIEKRIGQTTYLCLTSSGKRWKRHLNQIISRVEIRQPSEENNAENDDYSYINVSESSRPNSVSVDASVASQSPNYVNSPTFSQVIDPNGRDESPNTSFLSAGSDVPQSPGESRQVTPAATPVRRSGRISKPPPRLDDYVIGEKLGEVSLKEKGCKKKRNCKVKDIDIDA